MQPSDTPPPFEPESAIRLRASQGEMKQAMALALEVYGPELFGFLLALHARRVDAEDVFGQACHDLWQGFSAFQWKCSFRSWAYAVTRNAHNRHLARYLKKVRRETGISELDGVVDRIRTETPRFVRTENKARLHRLREQLSSDERMLLILRIDRAMSWNEIASVLDDPLMDSQQQQQSAAKIRKRFGRLTDRLRLLAEAEGLLGIEP